MSDELPPFAPAAADPTAVVQPESQRAPTVRRRTPATSANRARSTTTRASNVAKAEVSSTSEAVTVPPSSGNGARATNGAATATRESRRRAKASEVADVPEPRRAGLLSPSNAVFVSLCFEGPDVYSTAGGLGTRVTEFTEALAQQGYETHLIFVGDPTKPPSEVQQDGRLHLERWSQWISRYHPNGVYDGEENKRFDYNETVPYFVYEKIARPAIEQGKIVVIIGEDWHTTETIARCSDLLHWNGVRDRAILMWNCNSLMSLHRINWGRLAFTSTITTVSRYMKHKLWDYGVNPLVIPNGIPRRVLEPVDAEAAAQVRAAAQRGDPNRLFLFKIGRFDPDKRWLMAIEAAARLKYTGQPVSMVIRGGIEPHGGEVLSRARARGLTVRDIDARKPTVAECLALLRDAGEADIYNLRFFVPEEFVGLCYNAADAVLANSGHEPFGLVGLEVMARRGIAFTGSTGEDYSISFENAVALETEDPEEIVGYLLYLRNQPEVRERIRAAGHETAAEFTWDDAINNLNGKLGYLARKQSIILE